MHSAYKTHFDIPEDITYLSTPGSGLIPNHIKQWRIERDNTFFETDSDLREQQSEFIKQVKHTIAHFFGTVSSNVFCTSNFSNGFNTLLNGLPKDVRILLLADDYPSVNFPVISRDFDHAFVEINENLEKNVIEAIGHYKPDVFILSIVQYITGIKIDLSFIQELKLQYPNLLVIGDGTQFLGTEPFNFDTSGFDAVGCSGYKWLMSGFGNGFMILNDKIKGFLYTQAQKQTPSLEKMWEGKTILQLYFEPGHVDTLTQGTLQQSLLFLEKLGLEKVTTYTRELTTLAKSEFEKRGLLSSIAIERQESGNIFNLQIDPGQFSILMDNGIKCFPRGKGIRIGFYLYNDIHDLEKLLNVIDFQLKKTHTL